MLKAPSKSRITCQVCFNYFSFKEILFRCSNRVCPAENDPVRAGFVGLPQWMGQPAVAPSGTGDINQGEATCAKCQQLTTIHICPRCHCEIPQFPWNAPNMTLAIVGSVGAGKTVYLTTTMKHLQENLGEYLGTEAGVTISTKRTEDDIKKHEDAIFINNQELQTTLARVNNAEVRLPYTYHLASWNYRKGFHPLKKKLKTYLSIFDAAGEDFNDRNDTVSLKQIPNAQGLIMFIDPMSFPGIAEHFGQERFSAQTPTQILDKFYNAYVLQNPSLSLGDKIPVPTAFVLGKTDMLEASLAAHPEFNNPPAHKGGVDLKSIETSSQATRAILEQLGGSTLCGTIESRFSNHRFFAVSCGRKFVDSTGAARFQPLPSRIMDPILWMLWSNGRIPSTI